MHNTLQRTWAEIDMDALAHNYITLRQQVGMQSKFLGVVKADAYGHGAVRVAKKLEALGADYLGVSNVEEGVELRCNAIALPILLLGYTPPSMTQDLIANNITQDVPSLDIAQAYSKEAQALGQTLRVHLKLDTGMGRLGFSCDPEHWDKSLEEILAVLKLPNLEVEGIFTHFCVSDEPENQDQVAYTKEQYRRFTTMVKGVEQAWGHPFTLRHCCNSGGVAFYPEYALDMCRPGIVLYGIEAPGFDLGLRPVMTVKTAIGVVKAHDTGDSISYGRTYETYDAERLATVPIGYADGLQRCLSSKWHFWTPQGVAPICGRICMDMCMIDVTNLPDVDAGTEVEVFGVHNSVVDMAQVAGTIGYELLCGISKRVPRVYLEQGVEIDRNLQLLL